MVVETRFGIEEQENLAWIDREFQQKAEIDGQVRLAWRDRESYSVKEADAALRRYDRKRERAEREAEKAARLAAELATSVLGLRGILVPPDEVERETAVLAETRAVGRVGADRDRLKRGRRVGRNRNWRSRQMAANQNLPLFADSMDAGNFETNGKPGDEDSDGRRLFEEISKGNGVLDWAEYRLEQARERGEEAGSALFSATKAPASSRKLIVLAPLPTKGKITVSLPKRTAPPVLR